MSFDQQKESLLRFGVVYVLKYLGSVEILCSMRQLQFDERRALTRECIREVLSRSNEASGHPNQLSSNFSEFVTNKMVAKDVDLFLSGVEVMLTISVDVLKVARKDTKQIFLTHKMELVSFASGGDHNTSKCIAYVAKDEANRRVCYVLQSLDGLESMIISTIGQAFDLKYSDSLKQSDQSEKNKEAEVVIQKDVPSGVQLRSHQRSLPSDPTAGSRSSERAEMTPRGGDDLSNGFHERGQAAPHRFQPDEKRSLPAAQSSTTMHSSSLSPLNQQGDGIGTGTSSFKESNSRLAGRQLAGSTSMATSKSSPTHGHVNKRSNAAENLESELWFHGNVSRARAEELVRNDGDFLVRECSQIPGQYVLSGRYASQPKHLLLVDPHGVVRTRECKFDSISHLIYHHQQKRISIVSPDSELMLINPIIRSRRA